LPPEQKHRYCNHLNVNSKSLLGHITLYIQVLFDMNNRTAEPGGFSNERVNKIRVLFNGQVHKELDLAREPKDLQFKDFFGSLFASNEKRLPAFKKWRSKVYKTRKKLSLPVVPTEEELASSSS